MRFAKRVLRIKPSPTLAVSTRAKAMKAQGIDIIDFGAGEPDFDTPQNIKDAAVSAINAGFTKYTPVSGIVELKDAIIEKLKKDNGLTYRRNEIIVSCGAKHSLYNIAQVLFDKGDEVIIPAPYWVSYPDQAYLNDATPIIVPTREKDGFKLTKGALKQAITKKTKAIIINSPSNPTGTAYTEEELAAIADIALDSKIFIISDEIYEKLIYDEFRHVSIASLSPEIKKITIVVNGLSKSHSMTGWRIGYAAGPEEIITAMENVQSQSTSNPVSISQKAAIEALHGPQDSVYTMVAEFDKRRRYIVERLNKIEGVTCLMPQGAFYVFPNVKGLVGKRVGEKKLKSSSDIVDYLLEEAKVAAVAGEAFGAKGYIRLSYATSMENIKRGLDRIEEAVKRLE